MILDLTHVSHLFTGFFFLLSWSFFTYQHQEEIRQDYSSLGSSYWLGALGWVLLLVVESVIFIAEQAVVPDILPDLEKAVESWRNSSQCEAAKRSFSVGFQPTDHKSYLAPKRYMSVPWLELYNKNMTEKMNAQRLTLINCVYWKNWESLNPKGQWDWTHQPPTGLIVVVPSMFSALTEIKIH